MIVRNRSRRIGRDQAEYVFDDLECRTGNSDYTKIKNKNKRITQLSEDDHITCLNMKKKRNEKKED